MEDKKTYYGIDWLRVMACIGIAMMHIKANTDYSIGGFVYNQFISSLTDFVYLFMAISAFGMCCGYFEKVMSGKVDWTKFYKKRYTKLLPFFALLIVIDLAVGFSTSSLLEGITEITLLHGFIPQSLSVIGVGWYLGTVFVFYLIFPFFCVLIQKKSRAWLAFGISIVLHYICLYYFKLDRHNIIFSFCYFLAGGLIYLYRDGLAKIKLYVYMPITAISLFIYYLVGSTSLTILLIAFFLLATAISTGRYNKIISFISGISMEIYLSHMFVFRCIEKFHLTTKFGSGWLQYIISICLVIGGSVVFSYVIQKGINVVGTKIACTKSVIKK